MENSIVQINFDKELEFMQKMESTPQSKQKWVERN